VAPVPTTSYYSTNILDFARRKQQEENDSERTNAVGERKLYPITPNQHPILVLETLRPIHHPTSLLNLFTRDYFKVIYYLDLCDFLSCTFDHPI